jgi:hypothetical protein
MGRPLRSRVLAWVVLSIPALWLGYLVFSYGVDMPWGDQWEANITVLQQREAGTLNLGHFFAFHNEHRHFSPQLVSFALATQTHWNVRAELLADVGEPMTEQRSPYQYNRYNECGWSKAWNRRDLPSDARRISAWVFDAEECRASKIGDASVN